MWASPLLRRPLPALEEGPTWSSAPRSWRLLSVGLRAPAPGLRVHPMGTGPGPVDLPGRCREAALEVVARDPMDLDRRRIAATGLLLRPGGLTHLTRGGGSSLLHPLSPRAPPCFSRPLSADLGSASHLRPPGGGILPGHSSGPSAPCGEPGLAVRCLGFLRVAVWVWRDGVPPSRLDVGPLFPGIRGGSPPGECGWACGWRESWRWGWPPSGSSHAWRRGAGGPPPERGVPGHGVLRPGDVTERWRWPSPWSSASRSPGILQEVERVDRNAFIWWRSPRSIRGGEMFRPRDGRSFQRGIFFPQKTTWPAPGIRDGPCLFPAVSHLR